MAAPINPTNSLSTQKLVRFVYRFPLPATKMISFKSCFEHNAGNVSTEKTIEHMDRARSDMAHELASGTPNYKNVVASAEWYIPLIAQTLYSLEKAENPIYLCQPLKFDWSTGLGANPRTNWISNQAVVWDKCMSLASQAMAQANSVHSMVGVVEGQDDTLYAAASKELRRASGTFSHLAAEELPRWVGATAQNERLPEANSAICEGLATLCLAQAQQMAIAKALAAGKSPPTLLAKLCIGVSNQMDMCETILRDKGKSFYDKLSRLLPSHISFQSIFHRALAHMFIAQSEWAKDAYGNAIAHQRQANKLVRTLPNPYDSMMLPCVRAFKAEVEAQLASFEQDNSSIYYEPIPSEPSILPDGVSMMKSEAYPTLSLELLVFKNAKDEKVVEKDENLSEDKTDSA